MAESISAKFQLTTTRLYISAKYHDCLVSVSWPITDKNADRHIKTLLANLPQLIADGATEIAVRRELVGLDAEYESLTKPKPEPEPEDRGE